VSIRGYGPAPAWAEALAADVCFGRKARVPRLVWRAVPGATSHGYTTHAGNLIAVSAGTDATDQRMLLLHELAHALGNAEGHSAAFWRRAFDLYAAHGLLEHAVRREVWYKAGATREAARRGLITPERRDDLLLAHRWGDAQRPKLNAYWAVARMDKAVAEGRWEALRAKWEQELASWMAIHNARKAARAANPQCRNCGARGGHTSWCPRW
jgi:hypothetical protein